MRLSCGIDCGLEVNDFGVEVNSRERERDVVGATEAIEGAKGPDAGLVLID